jgi:PPK2 family polyphosphate:nucleotide phosphotransferase
MSPRNADVDSKDFRVREDRRIDLKKWPTRIKPLYGSKRQLKDMLRERIEAMSDLQSRLYASNRYALLLIFQALDAAGKDGAIKHVMSGINPQGCQVFSFKQPSQEELDHDFLWRTTCRLPERGRIGIFNRSYYEEVLVVRVHPEFLLAQGYPDAPGDKFWRERYRSIRDLEAHLYRSSTQVVKFFLHLSKGEQRKRFLARIDEPDKNWKFNRGDVEERKHWKEYMEAYEACLSATSTRESPWYVVPADDKANARLIISQIILDALQDLKLEYPRLSDAQKKELREIRKLLAE